MEDMSLLRRLCETSAVSGFEDTLIAIVSDCMRQHAARVEVDGLGNVVGWLNRGEPGAKTIMLVAHMDELGFVVRSIEDDGFLRLNRVGGIPEKVMLGQIVAVCPDARARIPGIIGGRPHHVMSHEEKNTVDKIEEVFVDIGAGSREEVTAMGIRVGTPITWWPFFHVSGTRLLSKSIDNRLALYILLELGRRLGRETLSVNVALVATVHEEWSAWGTLTAAASVQPDMAIALDIAIASDGPDPISATEVRLEGGPVLGTYSFHPRGPHMGTIPNPRLLTRLIETAESGHTPYQLGTFYGGFTDSSYLQYAGRGIAVADVGIPARYAHYPVEVASLVDASATLELLFRFLTELPADFDVSRG